MTVAGVRCWSEFWLVINVVGCCDGDTQLAKEGLERNTSYGGNRCSVILDRKYFPLRWSVLLFVYSVSILVIFRNLIGE